MDQLHYNFRFISRHRGRQSSRPHLPDDRLLQRPLQNRQVSDGGEGRRQQKVHQGQHRLARLRRVRIAGNHETSSDERSQNRRRRLWYDWN